MMMRCGRFSSTIVSSLIFILPSLARAYSTLSDATLKALPDPSPDFDIHNSKLLAPILIPRVPGTPNSLKVLQHFTDFWTNELPDWKIEYDNSTATTPLSNGKEIPFVCPTNPYIPLRLQANFILIFLPAQFHSQSRPTRLNTWRSWPPRPCSSL